MSKKNGIAAVGYVRRSTDVQETSIPDQKAYVDRWAKGNGYHIIRWYVDDAISATSTRGRDDFERLIREAENGRDFDAVLCYDISRFSRGGTNETGYYLHRLHKAGVEAVFCAEGIPKGDEGELIQGVKSWQARQYSVKLARDCIRGLVSHMTNHHTRLGSQAPFGYDRQYLTSDGKVLRYLREMPDGSRQELSPDKSLLRVLPKGERLLKAKSDRVVLVPSLPERVRQIQQMYEWCANGVGLRTIAIRLNAAGIRTPMGLIWQHSSARTLLRNPVYKGALVWNRKTKAKINGLKPDGTLRPPPRNPNGEPNNPDLWLVVENVHEPLVSPEVWQRAQDEMDRRAKLGGLGRPTNRYLLSGLIKCTHCGLNFCGRRASKRNTIRYYSDAGYFRYGRATCDPASVNAEKMDAFVLDHVRKIVAGDRVSIEKAIDRFVKKVKVKVRPDDRQGQIAAELKAVQKRIESAVALLTDGELDGLAELRETLVGLRRRRTALEAELKAARATAAPVPLSEKDLRAWAIKRLEEISIALDTLSGQALREVVHAYVIRIEIDATKQTGVLILPADALAILEKEHAPISRVNPGDAGFEAIKNAFLTAGTIRLAVLTGDRSASGTEGPLGDFSITNFSRNEPLEEGVTVSVTAKLAVFDEWVEVA